MKNVLHLLFLTVAFLAYYGCSKPSQNDLIDKSTVDSLTISEKGSMDSIVINNFNENYHISILPSGTNWIEAHFSISNSKTYLVFSIQQNQSDSVRLAFIQLISSTGKIVYSLKIVQPAYSGPRLTTDLSKLLLKGYINAEAGFKIRSNVEWVISLQPANTSWVSIDKTTGKDSMSVTLKALENNNTAIARVATITITPKYGYDLPAISVEISQNPIQINKLWEKKYMEQYFINEFSAVCNSTDNTFITAGFVGIDKGQGKWQAEAWLTKHDVAGNLLWKKQYTTPNGGVANAITNAADGGYAFAGYILQSQTFSSINTDVWIVKIDAAGNKLWEKTFGGKNFDNATSIATTPDGGFIVCGVTESNDGDISGNHGGSDILLLKLDASGNKVWQKCLGGSKNDDGTGVAVLPDGNIVISATVKSYDGDIKNYLGGYSDGWVAKLSSSGSILWSQSVGGMQEDGANAVIITRNNDIVICGNAEAYLPGYLYNGDMMLIRLHADGTKVWERALGTYERDNAFALVETKDNGFVVTGFAHQLGNGPGPILGGRTTAWLVKTDSLSNPEWVKEFGGTSRNDALGVIELSMNNFIVVGSTSEDIIVSQSETRSVTHAWINKFEVQ